MQTFRKTRPTAHTNSSNVVCLHPRLAADEELDWFFTMAESQMGVRSNYMDMLLPMRHREPHGRSLVGRIEAATAHRVIEGRLSQIGSEGEPHAGVLKVAYEVRPWPVALQDELGRLAGVVVRLASAEVGLPDDDASLDALERRTAEGLALTLTHHGRRGLARLRALASGRYSRAMTAYLAVRGDGPSVARRLG